MYMYARPFRSVTLGEAVRYLVLSLIRSEGAMRVSSEVSLFSSSN